MTSGKPEVVLLTNMLPHYRIEFFRELAELCSLHVVADQAMESTRKWEAPDDLPFRCTLLGNTGKVVKHRRGDLGYEEKRVLQLGKGVGRQLAQLKPDLVVTAELGMRTLRASRYCKKTKTPMVIWSEGTAHTEAKEKAYKAVLRRALVRSANGFWTNGEQSADYLVSLGADRAEMAMGVTGISTDRYIAEAEAHRGDRDRIRNEHGIEGCALLTVGSLSRRKGIVQYLDALRKVAEGNPKKFSLVFVGDGEDEGEVRAFSKDHPDVPVVVTGFLKPDEIFPYFAATDVFVLPTLDDNWPLVTLEALASGLPQLISKYNGASADLPKLGPFGSVVDPLDRDSFAQEISAMIGSPPARLSDSEVRIAADYYSPRAQAERAYASIVEASKTGR